MSDRPYPPISHYALIGDCHSAALISRDGAVDWCCFHRFDARPVFARILDWGSGGYFRVAPAGPYSVRRRYLPGTNILETTFRAERGVLVLTDCFPVRGASAVPSGQEAPFHQLIRLLRCAEGQVMAQIELSPRFDYGRTIPRLEMTSDHAGIVYGGADGLVIQSDAPMEQTELSRCCYSVEMEAGDRIWLSLTYMLPHLLHIAPLDTEEVERRVGQTRAFWEAWSSDCTYQGPYRDHVMRSALVLKGLTNAPTGAIVAAATTSLPEQIGGDRNWDYRFSWVRDSALDLSALFLLGYRQEAHAFMNWLKRTSAGRAYDLQTLYGVGGERLTPEVELKYLEGYRGSRPVRIGNAAVDQLQLDTYGELLDTAWLYHRHGGSIDPAFWDLLRDGTEPRMG